MTANASNPLLRAATSTNVPYVVSSGAPSFVRSVSVTIRFASGYGSGSSRIGETALKIAVLADADRERHDRDERKGGALPQAAQRVLQIDVGRLGHVLPAVPAHVLAGSRRVAKLAPDCARRFFG
jgi:hypothetical protein